MHRFTSSMRRYVFTIVFTFDEKKMKKMKKIKENTRHTIERNYIFLNETCDRQRIENVWPYSV